eukprot:SAG11_NODE_1276_length_5324_cov_2.528421_4_plen_79_part_00
MMAKVAAACRWLKFEGAFQGPNLETHAHTHIALSSHACSPAPCSEMSRSLHAAAAASPPSVYRRRTADVPAVHAPHKS